MSHTMQARSRAESRMLAGVANTLRQSFRDLPGTSLLMDTQIFVNS